MKERIPLKITFSFSDNIKNEIEKLIGEIIGKKLAEEYKKKAS